MSEDTVQLLGSPASQTGADFSANLNCDDVTVGCRRYGAWKVLRRRIPTNNHGEGVWGEGDATENHKSCHVAGYPVASSRGGEPSLVQAETDEIPPRGTSPARSW